MAYYGVYKNRAYTAHVPWSIFPPYTLLLDTVFLLLHEMATAQKYQKSRLLGITRLLDTLKYATTFAFRRIIILSY